MRYVAVYSWLGDRDVYFGRYGTLAELWEGVGRYLAKWYAADNGSRRAARRIREVTGRKPAWDEMMFDYHDSWDEPGEVVERPSEAHGGQLLRYWQPIAGIAP